MQKGRLDKMDVGNWFFVAVKTLLLLLASEVCGIVSSKADIMDLDVLCGKSGMNVHVTFDGPFQGIVFSKGYFDNPLCRYVSPNSALSSFTFFIPAEGCGTILEESSGRVILDSTLIFQQDPLFQTAWDNVRAVSCDWQVYQGKTVTSLPIDVAAKRPQRAHVSREVIDARLQIRSGVDAGETVHVGDKMTVVVLVNDGGRNYDIRVKNCYAYDQPIASSNSTLKVLLLDEEGCPLKHQLLSEFQITKDTNDTDANIAAYASMFAFRFPQKDKLFLSCGVEVCRSKCPNYCTAIPGGRLRNSPRESKFLSRRTSGVRYSTEVNNDHLKSNISSNQNSSSTRISLMKATMNIIASGVRNANRNGTKTELAGHISDAIDTDSNRYGRSDLATPTALEDEGYEDSSRESTFTADQNLPVPWIRDQVNEAVNSHKTGGDFVATVHFDDALDQENERLEASNKHAESSRKFSGKVDPLLQADHKTNSSAEMSNGESLSNVTACPSRELGVVSFDKDDLDLKPVSDAIVSVCVPKFRFYFIVGLIVVVIICLLLTILSLSLCLSRARRKLFAERYLLYRYS